MDSFSSVSQNAVQVKTNSFLRSVYNWMAIALSLTGLTAYYVSHNETIFQLIYGTPGLIMILIFAELGFVFFLSARIQKLSASTATALFTIYSILNGITLSYIFLRYTATSIASTFIICSVTFLACSIYGMVTKKDLTSLGGFMFMGLIGIIIASVVNIFLQSSAMQMIISYIGVVVFIGLTAYDTQKLKTMSASSFATIKTPSLSSVSFPATIIYFTSAPRAKATFPGSVQGVVVHAKT